MLHIYTTKSQFEVVRHSENWFHLLLLKLITLFDVQIMSRDIEISSKRKSNYYSRGANRLIKWIYKERYELLSLTEKKTTTYFPSSKQTQPKSLSQLAYLPPEKPRDIALIQLVRERVKRCWVFWIRSIVVIFYWISSIEGKWPRLFMMLAASFLSILWMCIPWKHFPLYMFSKIQLVVYYQCCVLIGWAATKLYAHQ